MALTSYTGYQDDEDPEFEMTAEERKLLEDAEGMQGFGSATGSALGTGLGTAAAAGLIATGAGAPLAALAVPAGAALGGWAGGMLGGDAARKAAEKYERLRAARLRPLEDRQRKLATFNQLMGDWVPNVRGL
jgi:hypothetical protein